MRESKAWEVGTVLLAQAALLEQLERTVDKSEAALEMNAAAAPAIADLERMMAEIEAGVDRLEAEDLSDFDAHSIPEFYSRRTAVAETLQSRGYSSWDALVASSATEIGARGLDPLCAYTHLLSPDDLARLENESLAAEYRWDAWDYAAVGASGLLASVVDFFLVRVPVTVNAGTTAGLTSPITAWMKQYDTTRGGGRDDFFASFARFLEQRCKTPYDQLRDSEGNYIPGMSGKTHRFQSLGHDPVIGFVVGVLDIYRGSLTGFSYDRLSRIHHFVQTPIWTEQRPISLLESFLIHLGHLISDVATPAGLPAPLLGLAQALNCRLPGGNPAGAVARWMYVHGYDLRHFLVMGLTPATVEMTLRAFIMLRHYAEFGETPVKVGSHPKFRAMLLMAHSIAALGNCGKVTLLQGNPLAINQPQWMALLRYLGPHVKYWALNACSLEIKRLEETTEEQWRELSRNGARILELASGGAERIEL